MRQSIRRCLGGIVMAAAVAMTAASASADVSPANPSGWIADLADRVIAILHEQKSPADQRERFRALIDERFDMPAIAQFVAGRYWRTSNEADRAQFTSAFTDYMVDFYNARFADYGNQTLKVLGQRTTSEGNWIVASQIVNPNGSPGTTLDWRITQTPHGQKITDVAIGGVSLAITKRDEFGSVIQRNGGQIAALTAELDRHTSGQRALR